MGLLRRNGLLFFLAAVLAAIVFAKSAGMPTTTPSSENEMKRLAASLSGTWRVHETDEPDSAHPAKVEQDGTEIWRAEPGGVPFTEQIHTTSAGVTSYDNAYVWNDADAGKIRGLWCASFNAEGCSPFEVSWEDQTIVMRGEFPAGGKRFAWVEKFLFDGPDRFTQTLDQAPLGEKLVRGSTIHAVRTK